MHTDFTISTNQYDSIREAFYNLSCYDALDFEMNAIQQLRRFKEDLFISETTIARSLKHDRLKRIERFLRIMTIAKYSHFAETLGAISLAFLNAKMNTQAVLRARKNEQKMIFDHLCKYEVGDVLNFYRDISKRKYPYLYGIMGYPPSLLQNEEVKKRLDLSCENVREQMNLIGKHFMKYSDIYNAYKHGYRIIPGATNTLDDVVLFLNEDGKPEIYDLSRKEAEELFRLSASCRAILEAIFENHKTAMQVSYGGASNISLKIAVKKGDIVQRTSLELFYPKREDLIEDIRKQEKKVLLKIRNIDNYSGRYILVDLDNGRILFSDRNQRKVIERFHREYRRNRVTIRRLTARYIEYLRN